MSDILHGTYDGYHPVFAALRDKTTLWRYMDLTKLLALLEDRALFFARADLLGDPFEGTQTARSTDPPTEVFNVDENRIVELDEEERERYRKLLQAMRPHRIEQRLSTWVNCWNHSEIESDALWGRYVHAGHGIAIRATFRRLTRSLGDPLPPVAERPTPPPPGAPWPVYVGEVSYVDYKTAAWPSSNGFWPFVHKRLGFVHEAEVRALVQRMPTLEDANLGAEPPAGVLIAVDLTILVEAICVSPVAPPWFSGLVTKVCKRYGVDAEVRQSELAATPTY